VLDIGKWGCHGAQFSGIVEGRVKHYSSGLTPAVTNLTLGIMGDKSPKATQKSAAQKQAKANAAQQQKKKSAGAAQGPKAKK
jgi:hypothetical protein